MIDRILRLGKETALYGLSTVVGRLLNFLLVPLYAHFLMPEENGVLATLYAYIAFATVIYGFGMEQSFMRFWADARDEERPVVLRRATRTTLMGVVVSALVHIFRDDVAVALGFAVEDAALLSLAAVILAADGISAVPFALLRMQRRPLMFALLKVSNIVLTIAGTVYLLVALHRGVEGVLTANLLASVVTLAGLFVVTRPSWHVPSPAPHVSSTLTDLWKFGMPLIPAGLAGMTLQVVDRPILKFLTDDATVGLYQINFRLGIFMMLFVGMFDFAWRPFFLQEAKHPDAPSLFARVFTYFAILLGTVFTVVTLFVDDLVRFPVSGSTLFPRLYWEGAEIVPLVLLGYIGTGMYVVFLSGTYLRKRTEMIPLIAIVSAATAVAGIVLLVPIWGIMGAAASVAVAHGVQAGGMYLVSRRLYPIPYEWGRVLTLAIWTAVLFGIDRWIAPEATTLSGIVIELGLFVLYLTGLYVLHIVRREELSDIVQHLRSSRRPTEAGL